MQVMSREQAERYARYRLPYADEAVQHLLNRIGPDCRAAVDLGAGTGLLTRHLAGRVPTLYAVEPELEMLKILKQDIPECIAIAGVAEATGLPDQSVDLILMANAYHRFSPDAAIAEFRRILRPGGWLANFSYGMYDATYIAAMSDMNQRFPEWGARVQARRHSRPLSFFYGDTTPETHTVRQTLPETWDEYWGAATAALEAPSPSEPWFPEFEAAHRAIFDKIAADGVWHVPYATQVTFGQPQYA